MALSVMIHKAARPRGKRPPYGGTWNVLLWQPADHFNDHRPERDHQIQP